MFEIDQKCFFGCSFCSLLEQNIQDLNRQVAVLLNEQQRRANGRASGASNATLTLTAAGSGPSDRFTADDAISEHLVAFTSIQVAVEPYAICLLGLSDGRI